MKIIDVIQILLFFIFAILIFVFFGLFAIHPKSNYGNIAGFFVFLGALNALSLYDRTS